MKISKLAKELFGEMSIGDLHTCYKENHIALEVANGEPLRFVDERLIVVV